ncbi:MAG: hypothetical protein MZV65_41480 [Chromatiales bacterium]|nr:hypothetical protein [Chromatiales bacterium]
MPPAALSGLSLATGIAVARALRDSGVARVGLKWPNDVLVARAQAGRHPAGIRRQRRQRFTWWPASV